MVSVVVSFVLSFFPRDVLDEILNLIESVSEDFPSYSCLLKLFIWSYLKLHCRPESPFRLRISCIAMCTNTELVGWLVVLGLTAL